MATQKPREINMLHVDEKMETYFDLLHLRKI